MGNGAESIAKAKPHPTTAAKITSREEVHSKQLSQAQIVLLNFDRLIKDNEREIAYFEEQVEKLTLKMKKRTRKGYYDQAR